MKHDKQLTFLLVLTALQFIAGLMLPKGPFTGPILFVSGGCIAMYVGIQFVSFSYWLEGKVKRNYYIWRSKRRYARLKKQEQIPGTNPET